MCKIKNTKKSFTILTYINLFLTCMFLLQISISNYRTNQIERRIIPKNSIMYHIDVNETIRPSTFDSIKKFRSQVDNLSVKKISYRNIDGKFCIEMYNLDEKNITKDNILDIGFNNYGYTKLKNHYFDGDYVISGEKNAIKEFEKKIKNIEGFKFGKIDKEMYISTILVDGFIREYHKLAFFIIGIFSLICVARNIIDKCSYIFTYKLLGFGRVGVIKNIILRNLKQKISFVAVIILFSSLYLIFKKDANIKEVILLNGDIVLLFSILVMFSLLIISMCLRTNTLMNRSNKYTGNVYRNLFTNIFFIMVSALLVIFLATTQYNINGYKKIRSDYESLTKIKNYANVNTSKAYLEEDFDLSNYRSKHRKLWEIADEKGGIYLMPGEKYLGYEQFQDAKFVSDYIEINGNYLNEINIKDINGNRIKPPKNDKYTITVLVPKRYKNDTRVLRHIRSEHIFRANEGLIKKNENINNMNSANDNESVDFKSYDEYVKEDSKSEKKYLEMAGKLANKLKEDIVYIDDNQKFYSFSDEFPVHNNEQSKNNYMLSPLTYIINSSNYNDIIDDYTEYGGSTYYTAIDNGYMHFKIKDYNKPEKDIMPILKKYGLDKENVKIFTIGDMVEKEINQAKSQMNIVILVTCLTILILLILISSIFYQYVEENRRIISVKYFMGFPKIKIYETLLIRIIVGSIFVYLSIIFIPKSFMEFLSYNLNVYLDSNLLKNAYILFLLTEIGFTSLLVRILKINYIDIK
ncbi:MAG: hypothetical protein SPJ36_05610 [Peptostreptococcus porci]|nr:hypothetical protein [Peptostreptococcus porci]